LAAVGQWQNYLLFANSRPFHSSDPLFHMDLSFYVFSLPFLSFVVRWTLGILVATALLSVIFHYLNGGVRPSKASSRVTSSVKVHLSVLLALMALVKAIGYFISRWQLVFSGHGYVSGAGYTDVHARLPAYSILVVMSVAAALILLWNIRVKGWSLPMIALGLWAFVALVIGVIYPAGLQALKVSPAVNPLELPYIQRNIDATRSAFGLEHVVAHPFTGSNVVTAKDLSAAAATLANTRLWDPDPAIALQTVRKTQRYKTYYTFSSLEVDRYNVNGVLTPVLVGAREINSNNLPSSNWVNQHLSFTHGYGMVAVAANNFDPTTGNPVYNISGLPPQSTGGLPTLTQPAVYFGLNSPGWVVANSGVGEVDYSDASSGAQKASHYSGHGGVQVGGWLRRAAFAVRFGDYNMFLSSQIHSQSRVIFLRSVLDMARTAAPFLSFDSHPYPVIADGRIKYVIDGYTTSSDDPVQPERGRPERASGLGSSRFVQLRSQRRQGGGRRLRRFDDLLRQRHH
jgi:uncharacterized membrane protein (UPF0182 family)